ncbi:MAG: glycosyltransferase [Polyangiaceae bacterium]|nr:glycosyltransferase [Polyangiaceae bacterium]
MTVDHPPLYILLLSVHGLIRGHDLELGRDADTGGQTTYVVELARTLARHPDVERVDLVTQLIDDPAVAADYSQAEEPLGAGVRIVRVPCVPTGEYRRKELLWPHLDAMVDGCLDLFARQRRSPDLIHSHYADAGYVGRRLSTSLDIPQIHTGHSLGRVKRARLLASGREEQAIEGEFKLAHRIGAEEDVLDHASLVIASTQEEVEEQYGLYAAHRPDRTVVIPPGVDTSRFYPPGRRKIRQETVEMVDRLLSRPDKPFILRVGRPAKIKNLSGLMDAYGSDPTLQDMANLVIVAGDRDKVADLEPASREIVRSLTTSVHRHRVRGKVALPKRCSNEDLPELYRLAARRRGVYANPALYEGFGLVLIEAAASGLPLVATENGGPREIIAKCRNGLLVNPHRRPAISTALKEALRDSERWERWSKRGIAGVQRYYSWDAHVATYMTNVRRIL